MDHTNVYDLWIMFESILDHIKIYKKSYLIQLWIIRNQNLDHT